jgi:multidrug transporter EmrE-like cation transporter
LQHEAETHLKLAETKKMINYFYLGTAVVFEILLTICAKKSEGLTSLSFSILLFVCAGISLSCLSFALESIPLTIAYPVWTGSSILIVALFGILYFQEPVNMWKLAAIFAITWGIIILSSAKNI